jgi:hypothetical protein
MLIPNPVMLCLALAITVASNLLAGIFQAYTRHILATRPFNILAKLHGSLVQAFNLFITVRSLALLVKYAAAAGLSASAADPLPASLFTIFTLAGFFTLLFVESQLMAVAMTRLLLVVRYPWIQAQDHELFATQLMASAAIAALVTAVVGGVTAIFDPAVYESRRTTPLGPIITRSFLAVANLVMLFSFWVCAAILRRQANNSIAICVGERCVVRRFSRPRVKTIFVGICLAVSLYGLCFTLITVLVEPCELSRAVLQLAPCQPGQADLQGTPCDPGRTDWPAMPCEPGRADVLHLCLLLALTCVLFYYTSESDVQRFVFRTLLPDLRRLVCCSCWDRPCRRRRHQNRIDPAVLPVPPADRSRDTSVFQMAVMSNSAVSGAAVSERRSPLTDIHRAGGNRDHSEHIELDGHGGQGERGHFGKHDDHDDRGRHSDGGGHDNDASHDANGGRGRRYAWGESTAVCTIDNPHCGQQPDVVVVDAILRS